MSVRDAKPRSHLPSEPGIPAGHLVLSMVGPQDPPKNAHFGSTFDGDNQMKYLSDVIGRTLEVFTNRASYIYVYIFTYGDSRFWERA